MIRSAFPILTAGGRNLPRICSCVNNVKKCLISSSCVVLSDTKTPSELTRRPFAGTEDVLADQLMKAHSAERIVDLLKLHHSVMNNQHLVIVLEMLCNLKKEHNLTDLSLESSDFKGLCLRLQQRARFYDVDCVINILKFLSILSVRTDSPVMQHYFQMLRHQVNELTLRHILYIDFLLEKQTSTPLVDALQIALPMVLENQIELQLDPDNIEELVRLFDFASKHNLKRNTMQKIIDAIVCSKKPLNIRGAQNIVWSCLKIRKSTVPFSTVFNQALNVLVVHINDVSISRLIALASVLSKKEIRYMDFWDALCKKAVEESWPFLLIHPLICSLCSLSIVNLPLLDKYAELIERNSNDVQYNPKLSLHSIIGAFSLANYRTKNMDAVLKAVLDSVEKINDFRVSVPELFVRFVINLTVLNCNPNILFEEVCQESFIQLLVDKLKQGQMSAGSSSHLRRDLLLLHQLACMLDHPFDLDPTLKTEAMHILKKENNQFPLQRALQRALGGPQYIQTGIFTHSGVFIDHLLVVRKGNYPVAFNGSSDTQENPIDSADGVRFIEDVVIPDDAKKVTVLVQWHTNTASNIKRVTGPAQLPARILAHEGYLPVVVPLVVWEELPEHERIPYIMQEIKLNVDSRQALEIAQ